MAIDRIPHQPPARLLERLIASNADATEAELVVREGPWLRGGALSPEALIEALAQTCALHAVMNTPEDTKHAGALAAVSHFAFATRALVGETVRLHVRLETRIGPLAAFEGVARVGDREVARGELRVVAR